MPTADALPTQRPRWQRALCLVAGACSLMTGIVGIFLPLLPTTPFVLLASRVAACAARPGCWATRASGRWCATGAPTGRYCCAAKQLATAMMALGSAWAWWVMPPRFAWLPALLCASVAAWMWSLPTAVPRTVGPDAGHDPASRLD